MDDVWISLHTEGLLMCLIMMVIILVMELSTRRNAVWRRYMPWMYACVICQLVIDIVWYLIDKNPDYILFQNILNTLYFLLYPLMGWLWFEYCSQYLQDIRLFTNKRFHYILLVPMGVIVALVLGSWKTGLVFDISADGEYIRGPFLNLTLCLAIVLFLAPAVVSLVHATKVKSANGRRNLVGLIVYVLPPIVFGVVQLINPPGITGIFFGFVISLLLMLIDSLRQQITQDNMTGLINHRTIDKKLQDAVIRDKDNSVFYILCDLDRFKSINDRFGHGIGDEALKIAGRVLEKTCRKYDATPSRLHGDEFAIVAEETTSETVEKMMGEIEEKLRKESETAEYDLSFSYGISQHCDGITVNGMFKEADDRLYEMKREKYGTEYTR